MTKEWSFAEFVRRMDEVGAPVAPVTPAPGAQPQQAQTSPTQQQQGMGAMTVSQFLQNKVPRNLFNQARQELSKVMRGAITPGQMIDAGTQQAVLSRVTNPQMQSAAPGTGQQLGQPRPSDSPAMNMNGALR